MKYLRTATAALILSAGSAAAQPVAAAKCSLSVSFGSYAMGIDRPTFERVDKLLKRDRSVIRNDQQRWGREGEVTMCVTTRRASDARRLFARVKAVVPRKPRGPVTVELGRHYRYPINNKQL